MTCKSNEFFKTGRCYDEATTCGAGEELDGIGLCYPKCKPGFTGVGPVCWSACEGKLGVACVAGCAISSAECGLATTDMVASPLESALSIATLSGYSAAKSARKAGTIAARKAAQSALVKGGKKLVKTGVKQLNDVLEAASRATGAAQIQAAAGPMTKAFVKNAKTRAAKAGNRAVKLRKEAPVVLKKMVYKVFAPVADKGKLAAETGWEYTKKGWMKVKGFVKKDQPKPPLPGWELDPDGFPGLLDLATALPTEAFKAVKKRSDELYKQLSQKRKLVAEEESVQVAQLVRECTTAGFTVNQAALR